MKKTMFLLVAATTFTGSLGWAEEIEMAETFAVQVAGKAASHVSTTDLNYTQVDQSLPGISHKSIEESSLWN